MEFAFLTWLYDKRYFFGLPFLGRRLIKNCLLLPLLVNVAFIFFEEYGDRNGPDCCKGKNTHGCNRVLYQFLVVANIILIVFLLISAEYSYSKKTSQLRKSDKSGGKMADVYF
mmetsp:Transcript_18298/g.21046  ORF Transcript_18298/g.21046 Transcript_18298/m.21046 type:complete len:113 (-) Transcript_18298:387-725(-)